MKTFELNMGWSELVSFFLRRKECVDCRVPLERRLNEKHLGKGWHRSSRATGLSVEYEYTDKTVARLEYRCPKCERVFQPGELPWRWARPPARSVESGE